VSGGPSSTVFVKVASTKREKNKFRRKGICALKADIVAQSDFPPAELEVLNSEIICHKMH